MKVVVCGLALLTPQKYAQLNALEKHLKMCHISGIDIMTKFICSIKHKPFISEE